MLSGLRFRANFFKTINGTAAVLRRIESIVPEMEKLNLPPVLYDAVDMHKGLVLVTGPTGSGKTTTIASIINEINRTRKANIITVEDPVEFVHKDKLSIVSQREVGKQTQSFSNSLRAALREDPDVIFVGELRDLETISLAMTAAETGHVVFGTLHTSGAPETINRIIDVFPPEQQSQIKAQISNSVKMVITQRLIKTKDGLNRVAAFEVMKCTPPVQNLIREGKVHQIPSVIQTSAKDGMIEMKKSLDDLIRAGKIDGSVAKE
jgi:twitching motility protein PilT